MSAMAASTAMEDRCFEMAKRIADSLPGGRSKRSPNLQAIRAWLKGSTLEQPDVNNASSEGEDFASDEVDSASCTSSSSSSTSSSSSSSSSDSDVSSSRSIGSDGQE